MRNDPFVINRPFPPVLEDDVTVELVDKMAPLEREMLVRALDDTLTAPIVLIVELLHTMPKPAVELLHVSATQLKVDVFAMLRFVPEWAVAETVPEMYAVD